ncbi:futalosine hydrolase [Paenibacillus puldeungensis]|uniref:Futalosine hydrolase n=1 Tax=Paenibacillus puldeungensis TaxID=696536 RepID=A0ABW3S1D1_9BACL
MKVLIMTAVEAEREAVIRGLGASDGFEVRLAGVGPAGAAAATAAELARSHYDLVISAGIGGGFPGIADIGSLVVASDIIAADLGAESPEGFVSVEELGFGSSRISVKYDLSIRWLDLLKYAGLAVHYGPVLTLSTVTGTAETAEELSQRISGAAAEAMEGFGVAEAARQLGIPIMELRAISNLVGPRQRDLWRIDKALLALEQACSLLPEVLKC